MVQLSPRRTFQNLLRRGLDLLGYELAEKRRATFPPDIDPSTSEIVKAVQPFTLTSPERIHALCEAVRYVVRADIPGAVAECGVWRGGSMLAVILTLQALARTDRPLYLYDTFEGMTRPTDRDVDFVGVSAAERFEAEGRPGGRGSLAWVNVSLDEVRDRLLATGYPSELLHFIPGPVEATLPEQAPPEISLLRLDTDWYESTRHELEHLFPLLVTGGVIIIDDYGHWQGARQAVDEYLANNQIPLLLNRIDYTGRIGVVIREVAKPSEDGSFNRD